MDRIRIGIVAAEFNYDITFAMVELAKEHARFLETDVVEVVRVPGVFDMPLAVKKLLQRDDIDGLVALGAVIEGSTEHDEIVAQHASRKIADLALDYEKPVGLGITGPGMSRLEAHQRVEYAKRAVEAAVKMVKTLRTIGAVNTPSPLFNQTVQDNSYQANTTEQKDALSDEDDPLQGFFKEFG